MVKLWTFSPFAKDKTGISTTIKYLGENIGKYLSDFGSGQR